MAESDIFAHTLGRYDLATFPKNSTLTRPTPAPPPPVKISSTKQDAPSPCFSETPPLHRLPSLIETTTDDALVLAGDLAEGTALGLDAAGTALWEVTKELGGWVADSMLRPVLTPVHEYRTSTRRVQDALDEERVVALKAAGRECAHVCAVFAARPVPSLVIRTANVFALL